jgi:hypothetical protein
MEKPGEIAGVGMAIDRVVAWVCGLDHVRETILVRADAASHLSVARIFLRGEDRFRFYQALQCPGKLGLAKLTHAKLAGWKLTFITPKPIFPS